MKKRWKTLTIRLKMLLVVSSLMLFILAIIVGMFQLINRLNKQVEVVYTSNVRLNELDEKLTSLEDNLETYVNTKSSGAMESYFKDEQEFRELAERLNGETVDDKVLLAEKNIRGLSESYLQLTAAVIQAKRGRNVEKYGALSEQASKLCDQIHDYIFSLNNEQFKTNSASYKELIRVMNMLENIMLLMLVLLLIGALLAINTFAGVILNPLKPLAAAANEVAEGNLELEELPIRSKDEIGIVTEAFNQMISSIRTYIEQIRNNMARENELRQNELLMQGLLKEAELKYLQAQINPHFLFNTLNAGAQLAMMEGAEKTEELLDNTAAFFRYNVGRGRQDASIAEEIGLVDNYIYICKVRFGDTFTFEKDIDEALTHLRVPSMILQPLVENAMKYGVQGLEQMGRMELMIAREGDQAVLTIWDNGTGMTKERIEQVMNGTAGDAESRDPMTNGVGIRNVMERLRLYFDNRAEFVITSEGLGFGTEISIRIPIPEEDEGEQ